MKTFAEFVRNSYLTGDHEYDIVETYSRTAALCAIEGCLADLNKVKNSYIDLEKTWWPSSLTDCVTIDDSIYFLSGDISTNSVNMMYSIYCNLDMYSDLDGGGVTSAGDRYGFVTNQLSLDSFYLGSGLRLIERDEEDILVISPDFVRQKAHLLVTALTDFCMTQDIRLRKPRQFSTVAMRFLRRFVSISAFTT